MINFTFKPFNALSLNELYDLLRLRCDVFVKEQNCAYQDLDNKDQKAIHLLAKSQDKIVGYARILFDEEKQSLSFGRLVSLASSRKQGLGKKLMAEIMRYFDMHHHGVAIKISAQCYLKHFYEQYGFVATGEPYDEDGLPHIEMNHAN